MRDLVAADDAVVPGIDPDPHALANRRRKPDRVGDGKAGNEHAESHEDERQPAAGDGIQRDHDAREDECRPEVLLEEEEREHERHASHDGPHVAPAGQANEAKPRARRGGWFGEFAQQLEPARERTRDGEHDQQADHFHRLPTEQVDLDAARARTRAEDEQERGQSEGAAEGQEHGAAQDRRLVVDFGRDQEQHETNARPADECRGDEPVAQRIAQRDHAHEAQAAEHHQDREQRGIVVGSAPPAHEVRDPEKRKEGGHRCANPGHVLIRSAHDHVPLQRGHIRGGKKPHGAGSVAGCQSRPGLRESPVCLDLRLGHGDPGQRPDMVDRRRDIGGAAIHPFRDGLALGRARHHRQRGQEIGSRRERAQMYGASGLFGSAKACPRRQAEPEAA